MNYLNGMIYNGPNAANNNQASQFGNKVGSAQKGNVAPRFGFAYDVFGDGRTALRGGYGWAYDDVEVSYYETTVFKNPPAVATYSIGQTSFESTSGGTTPAACVPGTTNASCNTPGRAQGVPLNYKTPYTQQYSLDLQQQLSPRTILDVGYYGSHGTHLLGGVALNEARPMAYQGVVSPALFRRQLH